jgi:hypothetical protein
MGGIPSDTVKGIHGRKIGFFLMQFHGFRLLLN